MNRLNWKQVTLIAELLVTLCFFFIICVLQWWPVSYTQSKSVDAAYCATAGRMTAENIDRNCLSFWYRTINDPAIAWNFYYSCLTLALVLGAVGTIFVTSRSIRVQREAAERLYVADQRPWISADLHIHGPFYWTKDSCGFGVTCNLKNSGKTPALRVKVAYTLVYFETANSVLARQFDYADKAIKEEVLATDGITIFPNLSVPCRIIEFEKFHRMFIDPVITKASFIQARRHRLIEKMGFGIIGTVFYETVFDNVIRETGFIYQFRWDDEIDGKWGAVAGTSDCPKGLPVLDRWFEDGRLT